MNILIVPIMVLLCFRIQQMFYVFKCNRRAEELMWCKVNMIIQQQLFFFSWLLIGFF